MAWEVKELKEHYDELRELDRRLYNAVRKNYEDHFDQLNENAKRTIEERSHFVSYEAFEPFKELVVKYMATQEGSSQGSRLTMGKIYAAIGAVGVILGVIVLFANGKI